MTHGVRKLGLLVAGLSLVLAVLSALGDRGVAYLLRLDHEASRLEASNADLKRENAHLILRIRALRDDRATLEQVARDELGLVKPGEVVFRFVPDKGVHEEPAP